MSLAIARSIASLISVMRSWFSGATPRCSSCAVSAIALDEHRRLDDVSVGRGELVDADVAPGDVEHLREAPAHSFVRAIERDDVFLARDGAAFRRRHVGLLP
jgi:hypothetical protein